MSQENSVPTDIATADALLTPDQVCYIFQIPKASLYGLTHRRAVPFLRVGKHLRFRRAELERCFEAAGSGAAR